MGKQNVKTSGGPLDSNDAFVSWLYDGEEDTLNLAKFKVVKSTIEESGRWLTRLRICLGKERVNVELSDWLYEIHGK